MPKKRNSNPEGLNSTPQIDKKVDKKVNKVKTKLNLTSTNLVPKGGDVGYKSSVAFNSEVPSQSSTHRDTSAMKSKKPKNVSTTIQKFLHKSANVAFNKTFICCKESYIESPTSFYGCFYLGPFPESLSLTLSHNLRRTLLSEIAGLGITAVEIDGVLHKYSNIPGIKETVLDILSNVQNIVFVKTRLANSFVAFLKVRGPGVVKASDIRLPAGVALVNPDQHIATLAEDGVFNMKIWIHEGKNAIKQKPQNPEESNLASETSNSFTTTTSLEEETNISGDYNKKTNTSLKSNKLYLDSVFMPVTKVNSFVETNFKATDDPAKTAPFVFGHDFALTKTTSFGTKEQDQQDSNTFVQTKLDKNHSFTKSNYFDFLSAEQTSNLETSVANYLVLKSTMSGVDNFESAPSHIFAAEQQTSIIARPRGGTKQTLLDSRPRKGQNPILMSPVTYNQPAKQCHIVLEIWTNGSIHPRQALKECLTFLAKTFIGLSNVKILGSMYKSHMTYQKILTDL